MTELQIIKLMRPEASRSVELRHLLRVCVTEAREIFPRVHVIALDAADQEGSRTALDPTLTTLIIGDADVLVARRSLEAMLSALSGGREVAVPSPIHSFAAAAARPLYSLCGFEDLERTILTAGESPRETPSSHLPVALVSPRWLERVAPDCSIGRLLTEPGLLQETCGADDVASTGVFFELADYYGQRRDDI
ncbi:MAG: hypothetical protein PVJ51_04405, partial [Acidobacteriota bacterium]